MIKPNNIDKQKRMLVFYIVNIILFLIVVGLSLTVMLITKTNTSEPTTQGLYPSIGLGNYFPESELDHWIDTLALELYDKNGVPQTYERVRDIILEHYTLIDGVYYYCENENIPSQFFRKRLCNLLGFINMGDWKEYPFIKNIEKTIVSADSYQLQTKYNKKTGGKYG